MKNKMKEVRLRYNDQEELQALIICAEGYLYSIEEEPENTTYGFESLRIAEIENRKTGIQLSIGVRRTKTGIVIAETRKVSHIKDNQNGKTKV